MKRRKVCVVTGTRADYGLLRWVMAGIAADSQLQLQVVATGMHMAPEFGLTWREIEADGFRIDRKVEMLAGSDTAVGMAKSIGLGAIGMADVLDELRPDLLLLLGDRFEIFAAAAAALPARIPVAHLHGGESTVGAVDEALRHSITKMAHFHFVATEQYRRRVIQLGEDPARVFLVGGLGIDNLRRLQLLDRAALEQQLGLRLRARSLLVTFHPATLSSGSPEAEMAELLAALAALEDTSLVFTLPNADSGGRALSAMVRDFADTHEQAHCFASLGQLRYLSLLAQVDAVVGNSSSGLTEAPSLRVATIDIGDRQLGRIAADSVIHCAPERAAIAQALQRAFSPEFRALLREVRNPYDQGGASDRVVAILSQLNLEDVVSKAFHDLPAG
jgi:GDP/UDP-N,N'-diacetylbacillosamine 2-epimerase (hydrolysing)